MYKKWHRSNFIGLLSLRIHIVHRYCNQLRIPTSLRIHDIWHIIASDMVFCINFWTYIKQPQPILENKQKDILKQQFYVYSTICSIYVWRISWKQVANEDWYKSHFTFHYMSKLKHKTVNAIIKTLMCIM